MRIAYGLVAARIHVSYQDLDQEQLDQVRVQVAAGEIQELLRALEGKLPGELVTITIEQEEQDAEAPDDA